MDKLFYIDTQANSIREVIYTRDRAMAVAPMFYNNRKDALVVLKEKRTKDANDAFVDIMKIERELVK